MNMHMLEVAIAVECAECGRRLNKQITSIDFNHSTSEWRITVAPCPYCLKGKQSKPLFHRKDECLEKFCDECEALLEKCIIRQQGNASDEWCISESAAIEIAEALEDAVARLRCRDRIQD